MTQPSLPRASRRARFGPRLGLPLMALSLAALLPGRLDGVWPALAQTLPEATPRP
ncbi:hypothetical protein HMPREF0731_0040, partial [Pseudoroseomonas cervicalis ATCC 49957]